MGFVGSMLSGSQGAGFQAAMPNLEQAVSQDQVNQAYGNTQTGLTQQQNFVNALAAQNGIQNQSNIFNQQQSLANQLQGQTLGGGPNPALAQLNQTTAANTANQAALMASQRGVSSNPALLARQAAQIGAANQQGAAGQAATLRAQQQLASEQLLQGQQNLLGGMATQQVGQQQQGINNYNQFAQNEQQNLLNSVAAYNNAQVGATSSANSSNAQIAGINAQTQGQLLGGALNGLGLGLGAGKAHGGMIHSYAQGGMTPQIAPVQVSALNQVPVSNQIPAPNPSMSSNPQNGPQSFFGKMLQGTGGNLEKNPQSTPTPNIFQGGQSLGKMAGKGIGSGIGAIGSLFKSQPKAHGGQVHNFKPGGQVPGKAQARGDSYSNDTVPAMLSPNEIVIPRSVVNSEDPIKNSAQFVAQTLSKERKHFAEGGETSPTEGSQNSSNPPTINIINSPSGSQTQPQSNDPQASQQVAQIDPKMMEAFKNNQLGQLPSNQGPFQGNVESPTEPSSRNFNLNVQPNTAANPQSLELKNIIPGAETFQNPVQEQTQALQAEAAAKGKLGRISSQIYQEQAQGLKQIQENNDRKIEEVNTNIHNTTQDILNHHINPDRVYENMSVPAKISTAIGMILGGMGGAITHQENPAMKYLQTQIDRDVASQQADLGKKETLLSSYYKQYGDIQDATNMAKATLANVTASRLEKAASFAQNDIERQRALQAAQQIRLQYAPAIVEAGRNQALISQASQGGADQSSLDAYKARFLAPKGKEEQVEKDLKEFEDLKQSKQEALDAFDKAASMNTLSNRLISPYQTNERVNALLEPLIADTAKFSVNKFTEADQKAIRNVFGTLGSNPETISLKRAQLASLFDKKMHFPSLVGVGINTKVANAQSHANPPRFNVARK